MKGRMVMVLLCACFAQGLFAQLLPAIIDETELQFKVKQIDELMRRFNFEVTYDGKPVNDTLPKEVRIKNMCTLFDLKSFPVKDGKLNEEVSDFCDYVIENGYKLCYEDTTWRAEVVCDATFNGKKAEVSLLLRTEQIEGVLYHWVLTDVKSPLFDVMCKETKDSLFVSPAEHGISFITLPRIINLSVMDVNTIFHKGWRPDMLSVFYYLVAGKKLKMQSVKYVIYHFALGDYMFDVKRFEREGSYNSGWLINSLKRKTKKQGQ